MLNTGVSGREIHHRRIWLGPWQHLLDGSAMRNRNDEDVVVLVNGLDHRHAILAADPGHVGLLGRLEDIVALGEERSREQRQSPATLQRRGPLWPASSVSCSSNRRFKETSNRIPASVTGTHKRRFGLGMYSSENSPNSLLAV